MKKRTKPMGNVRRAVIKSQQVAKAPSKYDYEIKPPMILPGVVPAGREAPVMAMDYNGYGQGGYGANLWQYGATSVTSWAGFPGYPYLSQLATRAEYRAFADSMAKECTREWIKFNSKQDDGDKSADKIKIIEEEFKRLNVRGVVGLGVQHDCYFGRAQIFTDIQGADRDTPLILDKRTIKKGSFTRISCVEPIWTTPVAYNALDPVAPDFYKPNGWWMLGQHVHASRLLTIVTRPLPDILKPAFNFSGMSLSQLAEPYVDNWLRTRQSVSDLINNFSITALATSMDQVLQGDDDGSSLFTRADLFNATRSNRGLMLLDKDREDLVQVNTPLGTLDALQAQAQEHMCSVSHQPAIILTGISPTGLNASSEGEIRVWNDWVAAYQNSNWREPIDVILKLVQLNMFGEIDPDIDFDFVPLYQLTGKELAEVRESNGRTSVAYATANILSPEEVRDNLANDPESGYMGLDVGNVPVAPANPANEPPPDGLNDDKPPAQDHIIEEDGKFKLLSHKGKNLGIFDSREAAQKHEQQVNYFKAQ